MGPINYEYIIIGAGVAGAAAVAAIREQDKSGTILLVSSERHLPYDRTTLSKKLWFDNLTVEDIFLHECAFYETHGVTMMLGTTIESIDPKQQTIRENLGSIYGYRKLLLATGGIAKRLLIPGGDLPGVCYLRSLDDYVALREEAVKGVTALVVGGGFIGSEIAAALSDNKVHVTMIFPDPYIGAKIFPSPLGESLTSYYRHRGIRMITHDSVAALEMHGEKYLAHTKRGKKIEVDQIVVGIGITPAARLARDAGLTVGNGIIVNQYLQTSDAAIFAAGDTACFPYFALGRKVRIEHWDNALNQGICAGSNMVKVDNPYTHIPYFYSDLFKFGYEAVGDIDSNLQTWADWTKENDTGTLYYLKAGKVRGAMMCNLWHKVDEVRDLIRMGARLNPPEEIHQAM